MNKSLLTRLAEIAAVFGTLLAFLAFAYQIGFWPFDKPASVADAPRTNTPVNLAASSQPMLIAIATDVPTRGALIPPTATAATQPTAVLTASVAAPTTRVATPSITPTRIIATQTPVSLCNRLSGALSLRAGELGTAEKPVLIEFAPIAEITLTVRNGQAMADCLSKMTGLSYNFQIGATETSSVDAIGTGKAQVSFLSLFPLLLAKQKYDVDIALIALRRYGYARPDGSFTSFDFDPDRAFAGQMTPFYKSEYLTRTGSGIRTLQDIRGKRMCFVSTTSTSGGIVPRIAFKLIGLDIDKDMRSTLTGSHVNVAAAVYQGDCDAGVSLIDILSDGSNDLRTRFPDIAQKVSVFAVGERIPFEGVQFVKGLDPRIRQITIDALLAMQADAASSAVIRGLYNYDAFERADFARHYAPFLDLVRKSGADLTTIVR